MMLQFTCVRAFCPGTRNQRAQFISVPTHHQRLAGRHTSLPDASAFFRYPGIVQGCFSLEFCPNDGEFPATYLILYTYDRTVYHQPARAIFIRLRRIWFGEIVVLRCGRGNGNIVNMDVRRGDSREVMWRLIRRYLIYMTWGPTAL